MAKLTQSSIVKISSKKKFAHIVDIIYRIFIITMVPRRKKKKRLNGSGKGTNAT